MPKPDEIGLGEALRVLGERQHVSRPTLIKWAKDGTLPARQERHGILDYWKFKRADVEELRDLLPRVRRLGKTLLPDD